VLVRALQSAGHSTLAVGDGEKALHEILAGHVDLAFVDIRMPGVDGLSLLTRVREAGLFTPIVIVTAQDTMGNAIEAMKRGAYDYITKPFDIDKICALAERALEAQRMSRDLDRIGQEMRQRFELGGEIVGRSAPMQEIYKTIGRIVPTDVTVLIQGESGTGKELIAKAIHYHSNRWSGPFVALNCSAVPRELLESELFGHEKGAFTGAAEQRRGKFELAQGGTVFLDEIGDMPVALQTKLLRVLQERSLTPIGSHAVVHLDCRIIAATNQDLERAIKEQRFRSDLYFRLNVVAIRVPPLRERRQDIPALVEHTLAKVNREMGLNCMGLSADAQALLSKHSWPGNVRELENALVRAAVLAPGRTLVPSDFALAVQEVSPLYTDVPVEKLLRTKVAGQLRRDGEIRDLYAAIVHQVEKPLIELVLERTNGNQLQAAAMLGINRNTLRKKMTQLGIVARHREAENGNGGA